MYYSQKSFSDKLGTCACTIAQDGCFLVSFCNLLGILGIANIAPPDFNKKAYPAGGCMADENYWASLYNLDVAKTTSAPGTVCISETDHYANLGFPQHFFCYDPDKNLKLDPLDVTPTWRPNNYNIVSYRIFTKKVPRISGIDISHYQSKPNPIDWTKVSAEFVIIKVSGGDNGMYKDAMADDYKKNARAHGKGIGYYHYGGGLDPVKEADFFIEAIGDIATGENVGLDFEIHIADPIGYANAFVQRLMDKLGWDTLLFYSYRSLAALFKAGAVMKCKLWIADPSAMPNHENWPDWTIWQYTTAATGAYPGISTTVDLDYFNGTIEDFKKLGKPETPTPAMPIPVTTTPDPTPIPPAPSPIQDTTTPAVDSIAPPVTTPAAPTEKTWQEKLILWFAKFIQDILKRN